QEYHFIKGRLAFYYEKADSEIRLYFKEENLVRLVWDKEVQEGSKHLKSQQLEKVQLVQTQAQQLQKLYVLSFGIDP
ncbi:MAG: hypothetical protein AAFU64_07270, partial [Bacteroidota bacterium]